MANIKSAIKRARQNEKRRQHNASLRSRMRTHIKRAVSATAQGDHEGAIIAYRVAASAVDVCANKGLIDNNKARRHKRRLNTHVRNMAK